MLVIRPSECVLRAHFLALKAGGQLDPAYLLTGSAYPPLTYGIVPGSLHLPARSYMVAPLNNIGGLTPSFKDRYLEKKFLSDRAIG